MAGKNTKANGNKKANASTNFDAMRPVLVGLHNLSNKKVITAEYAEAFGANGADLNIWAGNIRVLWEKCYAYVSKRSQRRYDDTITEEVLNPLRDEVFVAWKTLIESGSDKNRLPIDAYDVEALTEFSWRFLGTENGTVEAVNAEKNFRLDVEKLVGVKIARNAMLSDDDRKALKDYKSAVKGADKAKATMDECDKMIKKYQITIAGLPSVEVQYKEFLEKLMKAEQEKRTEAETRKERNAAKALALKPTVQEINARIAKA